VSAPSSSPLWPKRKQRGRPSLPNCDNKLKKPPSAELWQQWQTILHWLIKEPLNIDQPQMAMLCTLRMDRLSRGVLTGKNGRLACNAFTTGCVWFKKDQVERHFQKFHLNDSTSKVVMGPLEKSLYTSIEMEEKRVKMMFK